MVPRTRDAMLFLVRAIMVMHRAKNHAHAHIEQAK